MDFEQRRFLILRIAWAGVSACGSCLILNPVPVAGFIVSCPLHSVGGGGGTVNGGHNACRCSKGQTHRPIFTNLLWIYLSMHGIIILSGVTILVDYLILLINDFDYTVTSLECNIKMIQN